MCPQAVALAQLVVLIGFIHHPWLGLAMLFSCDNIHMHFGARPVLQGISLGVHPGEVLGIVGPNGAGKTTLLEILSGRTKPTQGRVLFEGQDVTALPLHQRARRGLARTYQSPVVPEQLSV
jgi:ABC-type branched-subunit amino acid transport system ATPase component